MSRLELTDKEVQLLAHRIFCNSNECRGDTNCFHGIPEWRKDNWKTAIKKVIEPFINNKIEELKLLDKSN